MKNKFSKIKLLKRDNVIFTWTISYMIVLMLPIIISIIMYARVERIVKDEINRSNDFYLNHVQQYMDNIAEGVKQFSVEVAFDSRIQAIIPIKEPYTDEQRYRLYEGIKELSYYKTSNVRKNNFFIYLSNSDKVLSEYGIFDKQIFFDTYLDIQKENYEKLVNIIKTNYRKGQFIALPRTDQSNKKKIFYVMNFPSIIQPEISANFITGIDETQLIKMTDGEETINQGQLIIINKDNKVIAGLDKEEPPSWLSYDKLNQERGVIEGKYNGENVVVSYVSSESEECKYIHMMPQKVFWQKLEYARKIIYISVFFAIVLGSITAYILLKKNYAPMENLLSEIKDLPEQALDNEENEYQFIKRTIIRTMKEKEEYSQRLISQNVILKNRFLERLLKGQYGEITVNDTLVAYDINFTSKYFGVLLFYIEDFSEIFLENTQQDNNEAVDIAQFVINNIMNELVLDKFKFFNVETDEMLALIINLKDENVEEAKKDIIEITKKLQEFIKTNYKFNFTVAISDIHEDISGIAEAYNEVLEVIEYKIVMGVEGIILYDETRVNINKEYYYPIEKEQQLINYIKSGDFDNASTILEEVFNKNFKEKSISPYMAKCLFFNLVSSILKTINDMNTMIEDDFEEELNRIEELIYCKNANKVEKVLKETLNILCEKMQSGKRNKNSFIKDRVDDYIEKNYINENLSISAIADEFNMHPSYLSRLYKSQAEDGILDKISKVRIEKSKPILKEQKLNLEEVAKAVGYSNARTFTRAFIKLEGITPGKYKEI